jgi:superfamily II DNA or RNA helicase
MDWQTGDRVTVRGGDWKIAGIASFEDCAALDLCGERTTRTLLVPFDRPRFRPSPHLLVVSRRRSLQILLDAIRRAHPYGGLRACPPGIRLLAYQMEPALAVLRHGASRVLIADDVGLGKTVEAGLIIREIATADRLARSLVLCPASLRRQWTRELADRFELQAIDTDDGWMRRAVGRLPPDVNPWSLPGVYVASMDFVKRPEVLHPLEQVRWDLLVMDEAHAAAPGTNRRAAVHAIGCRASRVVLLTATPHSGRDDHFAALCRIGDPSGRSPIILFSRSRDAVSLGGPSVRSSVVALDLSPAEQTMHRLLDAYTTGIWNESRRSGNLNGELIATLLRKRALSSAAALEISLRRRLALLAGVAAPPSQLPLPLEAEDMPPDEEPEALLAAPGLSDRAAECHALGVIAESAAVAAVRETKLDKLLRFLSRARESAIVFSEYRDTAERLRERLAAAGHRVCVLHGGLTQAERDREMAAFAAGKSVMVATDAASEGLNLHHTCRLVVHFELPWTPSRLQQRCGRVNRIGQERRVHEIALVGRHTAEQLVLVPLLLRAARARSFSRSPLMDQLTESQVAAHVLGGTPVVPAAPHLSDEPAFTTIPGLADEARHEVERLDALRRLAVRRSRRPPRRCAPIIPISRPSRRRSRETDSRWRLGMSDGDNNSTQKPQRHERLLVVREAIVLESEGWPLKYSGCIHEVQTVLLQVQTTLLLVPGKPHMRSVYTSRLCVKACRFALTRP